MFIDLAIACAKEPGKSLAALFVFAGLGLGVAIWMELYLLCFGVAAAVFVAVVYCWVIHLSGYLADWCTFTSCHLGIASCHEAGLPLYCCHYHHW